MRKLLTLITTLLIAIACLAAMPAAAQDNSAQIHLVQPGENLFRIAGYYNTDVNTLAQLNGITNTWQIYSGQTLIIPLPGQTTAAPIEIVPAAIEMPVVTQTHIVRRGEYLASIARQYGISPEQLASLNGITNPNLIYAGQELIVSGGAQPVAAAEVIPAVAPIEIAQPVITAETRHIVRRGEYLSQIAAQYGVSWLTIAQANGIYDPNTVFAGMELIIPGSSGGSTYAALEIPPAAPPAAVSAGRSILVDLSDQRIYAYENGVLVRNVLVSTGLPATPTVLGDYTVQRKIVAETMAGPGYYLPDVPYTMYFFQGYAIHGTYWHSNFGTPMSHGCVNLPTPEAEWFYNWADYGTPVHVQI